MNKSIKKYLLLLIAVFMVGESRLSASLRQIGRDVKAVVGGEFGSSVAESRTVVEAGFLLGDATSMVLEEAMRDKRAFKKAPDLFFRLVWEGKLTELKQLWVKMDMSPEQKEAFFTEIKPYDSWRSVTTGTVFHYAALRGHFDVLAWLIEELKSSYYYDSLSVSGYFNNGSTGYQENQTRKQRFIEKKCHNNVLNCLYPWLHKCGSEEKFAGYRECMQLLLENGACVSDTKGFVDATYNLVCYSQSKIYQELPSLNITRNWSLVEIKCYRGLNCNSINNILKSIDNKRNAQITAMWQQKIRLMLRGFVVLGICAVAYKINLAQRVKSLLAGGFNFFGHRALAAGEALSH